MAVDDKHTLPVAEHHSAPTSSEEVTVWRSGGCLLPLENGDKSPVAIYRSLKCRLMAGEFPAGERLRPDTLKKQYGI
ncbi:MAG: hypothetical protein R3E89_19600, partial [Thiolinea sp.]